MKMVNCLNCDREIINKYKYHRKYCCKKCIYEFNREKILKKAKIKYVPRVKRKYDKICSWCGKDFVGNYIHQKYCSKECCYNFNKKKVEDVIFGIIEPTSNFKSFMKLRFELFKRDKFKCQYCGRNPKENNCKLVIDHIIPKNLGGKNETNNLITSCEECNLGKRDILLEVIQLNKVNKNG